VSDDPLGVIPPQAQSPRHPNALTKGEAMMVANQYIGNDGGYLGYQGLPGGRFSIRSHADFYAEYCGVNIDWNDYPFQGTTREVFIAVLEALPIDDQAKVLRGVVKVFTPENESDKRTELLPGITKLIARMETGEMVSDKKLKISSSTVDRALNEAEASLRSSNPAHAVDRIHTALHGHLRALCEDGRIEYEPSDAPAVLLKKLRNSHPKLIGSGPKSSEITRVLNAMATIFDAFNPIRNQASLAHANFELLGNDEARLVINSARSLLHYLDAKLS
jgi:hypothetical protein